MLGEHVDYAAAPVTEAKLFFMHGRERYGTTLPLTTLNLLMNRDHSGWTSSHLPCAGKDRTEGKAVQDLAMRIPGWLNRTSVEASHGKEKLQRQWIGRYLSLRGLRPVQIIEPERYGHYRGSDLSA